MIAKKIQVQDIAIVISPDWPLIEEVDYLISPLDISAILDCSGDSGNGFKRFNIAINSLNSVCKTTTQFW